MILADLLRESGEAVTDRARESANDMPAVRATLDDLFRRALERRPDALALADPPDRPSFTDGPVRRLTYAQADRAISALAARLRSFGLPTDSVVAIQLPNTVESVIALLAVLRAGMIAAPLPLLWRHADAAAALSRVAARALIGCQRIGDAIHGDVAMHIAMETFTIRFLCGFGDGLPDGVVPVDDIFTIEGHPREIERYGEASDHVALVTFDITADGIVPVARSHGELIAGGLGVHIEARIEQDAVILGALAGASFASLASTVVPWLLSGGTLVLHHPFAPAVFEAATRHRGMPHRGAAGSDGGAARRRRTDRSPSRPAERGRGLARARAIGRKPAMAGRRDRAGGRSGVRRDRPGRGAAGTSGKPSTIPTGRTDSCRVAPRRACMCSTSRATPPACWSCRVRWRRARPSRPAPNAAARRSSRPARTGASIPATPAASSAEPASLTIDGAAGRHHQRRRLSLRAQGAAGLIAHIADGSTLAALPDALAGQRLAGVATDRNAIREALAAQGANPLVVAAFRERRGDRASAA